MCENFPSTKPVSFLLFSMLVAMGTVSAVFVWADPKYKPLSGMY